MDSRPGERRALLLVSVCAWVRQRPLLVLRLLLLDTVAGRRGSMARCLGTVARWRGRLGRSWILRG